MERSRGRTRMRDPPDAASLHDEPFPLDVLMKDLT
jgi:hypothetical protein